RLELALRVFFQAEFLQHLARLDLRCREMAGLRLADPGGLAGARSHLQGPVAVALDGLKLRNAVRLRFDHRNRYRIAIAREYPRHAALAAHNAHRHLDKTSRRLRLAGANSIYSIGSSPHRLRLAGTESIRTESFKHAKGPAP